MKNILKNSLAVLAIAITLASCSNDDAATEMSGNGNLAIEFDNAYGANDLIMGSQPNTTSQGEILKISTVKYIVSNIVLTNENGTAFTYPKSQSYFIVDEANPASHVIQLSNIPSGNYTKIKFGIGVDQQQFELGASGQGNFLALAQAADLMWSWSAGYKFLAFEGTFTSAAVTTETPFMVHTGQTGTDYNYNDVTLDLPSNAMVRAAITPQIHIVGDVSKIIDGTNKINLTGNNMGGMGAMIMGGANLPLITANLDGMFSVNHVHND